MSFPASDRERLRAAAGRRGGRRAAPSVGHPRVKYYRSSRAIMLYRQTRVAILKLFVKKLVYCHYFAISKLLSLRNYRIGLINTWYSPKRNDTPGYGWSARTINQCNKK